MDAVLLADYVFLINVRQSIFFRFKDPFKKLYYLFVFSEFFFLENNDKYLKVRRRMLKPFHEDGETYKFNILLDVP